MFRQKFADLLPAAKNARSESGFAKITGHRFRKLPPENIAALCDNSLVAEDGKLMRARNH